MNRVSSGKQKMQGITDQKKIRARGRCRIDNEVVTMKTTKMTTMMIMMMTMTMTLTTTMTPVMMMMIWW